MSGSLSYLSSLYSSASSSSPLLNALYGIGTSSVGSSGMGPVQALQNAEATETQQVAATGQQPAVQTTMAAFTKAVNSATSVTQLLNNPAVMNVLLTANGMKDQIGYTALATQALTSNLNDSNSLANTLTDTRWKTLAQTYDFATHGLAAIQNPKVIAAVAQGYAQMTWENAQDSVTPGLSNALAFKASASTITSVDQILGDPNMRTVVTTALGIPQQIAFQSINAQEKAISSQLDITQFQKPSFVESFTQRYLIAASANAAASTSTTADLTSLAIQARGSGILV
jgi:hypothetical protein